MINTLTLNPAVDKILYIDKLEKNVTNRIQQTKETIGGKGTHVSINLVQLGIKNRAFGISHGKTGKKITEYLKREGLDVCFVERDVNDSRTNYLLIESTHDCTVIAEKGVPLVKNDINDIISLMRKNVDENDILVLSGDASNSPSSVYNYILDKLRYKKLKILLDTSGETLKKCINCSPYLIKPNLDELSTLCGRTVTDDTDDIMRAIDSLEKYGVNIIAVSIGKKGSIISTREGTYRATPPDVEVCNTIGCGDSFLASLIYGICRKSTIVDNLKFATAVSSAAAESTISVGFDLNRAKMLTNLVKIERIR